MRKLYTRATAVTAGVTLATGLVAVATPSAEAAGCSVTLRSYATVVRQGSKGAATKAAECSLRQGGYDATVNSRFSSGDAAALKKFQATVKLSRSGQTNRNTWTALLSRGATPRLTPGTTGSAVRRLQRALRASGRTVTITGVYDAQTRAAVKIFQSRHKGWKPTGVAGQKTWWALQHGQLGTAPKSSKGAIALAFAKKQLGDSYRYGATGPGSWDCSGLTQGAWKAAGVSLPHSASAQFHKGIKVAKKDLRVGDLVFFYSGPSHVAIYAGNGKVIHAARPGKPVAYIEMKYMPFAGARRPA